MVYKSLTVPYYTLFVLVVYLIKMAVKYCNLYWAVRCRNHVMLGIAFRCSLGDVTIDDSCYEKALEVSNDKSVRAKVV